MKVEGLYPGYGILIAGDFNKLDIKILKRNFQLKQLVLSPTCGANIFYDLTLAEVLPPPFG